MSRQDRDALVQEALRIQRERSFGFFTEPVMLGLLMAITLCRGEDDR